RLTTGAEQETFLVMRALEARTQIRLRAHLVPYVRPRRHRKVGQASILCALRPRIQRLDLLHQPRLQQRLSTVARLLQALQAQVVAPPLQKGETNLLVAKCPREERQVLPYQLLLKIDGVGGHHRSLLVASSPAQRRQKIAE